MLSKAHFKETSNSLSHLISNTYSLFLPTHLNSSNYHSHNDSTILQGFSNTFLMPPKTNFIL